MATTTPKALVQGTLLTAASVTLYTVPALTTAVVRSMTFCNTDTVDRTVTLHIVASGGSEADRYMIFRAIPIKAGETLEDDLLRVLMTGDFISAFADVTNEVSIRVDGAEIT